MQELKMRDQISGQENAGHKGPKYQDLKIQDLKMKDQMSEPENAGCENAGPNV